MNEKPRNNTFWRIVVAILLSLLAATFGYGILNNKVEENKIKLQENKQINNRQDEEIKTVLIQQGRMEAQLESIDAGIERIEKKIK